MSSKTEDQATFETTADYEVSTLDYYQEQFDKWIGSSFRILWNDYRGKTGIIIITFYLIMGTVGPLVVPVPSTGQGPYLLPPFQNPKFILGTDGLGQSMLGLMVHATPAMFKMMFAGAIFGNFLGVTMGLLSGYLGGVTDKVIMTVTDTMASIPGLPLILILAAIIQPKNPFLVGIILNIQGWAGGARGIRAQVLPIRDEEYVEASRAMGQPTSRILVRDILPNLLPLIFIGFLGGATTVITASVGLYFLGILPFTTQNWGVVLNYAYQESGALYNLAAAHWLLIPLITIVGLTFSLTLLAQAFDQVFNPRVRARHEGRKRHKESSHTDGETTSGSEHQISTR